MSFIREPDTSKWDCAQITDAALLAELADTAVANLRNLAPDVQQAILAAIKDLPPTMIDLEDIAHCALGQDEYGVEKEEIDDDVVEAAWKILTRDDILPLVDVESVMELIVEPSTPYRAMTAGVALLEQMPAERIPFDQIVEIATEHADDDEGFSDAVVSLWQTHERFEDMQQCYDEGDDPDDDTYLGALCREAVEAHDAAVTPAEVQAVAQPS